MPQKKIHHMTDFLVWWVLKGEQIERRGGVRMGTDCVDP